MNVIDDTIDFDAYLSGPPENANIKPASHWLDSVLAAFRNPPEKSGTNPPWAKVADSLRFRHGELTIWPGMNGHGKSMLVGQVMLSLMEQGERVCIISLEMKPHETMQRICRQAFARNTPSDNQIRDLSRWTDDKLWLYDQQGEVTPERILSVARYCHTELGINHLVIDNLLGCGIPEDGEGWMSRQKKFILDLSCHAHDTRQSVHLLAHVRKGKDELAPPSKYDIRGSASISDLADNVHTVWRNKGKEAARQEGSMAKEDEADCLLIIDKNRHGGWEGKIRLWFDPASQSYVGNRDESPRAMRLAMPGDEVEF